jgi:nucleoside-diphosphate-sugar epimerase
LDVSRAQQEFGFKATTDFRVGIQRTVEWYLESLAQKA